MVILNFLNLTEFATKIMALPSLDLKEEIKNGTFVRNFIKKHNSIVTGCHDISEGGIF